MTVQKYIITLLVSLIAIIGLRLNAQDIVVVGQVLSEEDAAPLEAAHVSFKGTDIGTITNEQGFFMIRSPKPQKKLVVSIVGYTKKTVALESARDQMLEIFLRESVTSLDDIYIFPGENPAFKILRNIDKNRKLNNPDKIANISYNKNVQTNLNLTNIKQKAFQRKLFAGMLKGAVTKDDSTYILPVLVKNEQTQNNIYPDSAATQIVSTQENAINILSSEHWNAFVKTYSPEVNFYNTYIPFLNKAILSPIASQGRSFYNYYLTDSLEVDSTLHYIIKFSPKAGSLPLFKGVMTVNSETYALANVDVGLDASSNINFVSNFSVVHDYTTLPASPTNSIGSNYYSSTSHNVGLKMSVVPDKKNVFWGAMLSQNTKYSDLVQLDSQLVFINETPYVSQSLDSTNKNLWEKIDTVNQTRLRKFVEWAVDLGINQYLHLWKIDVGPVLNLFRYNALEGPSPRLTMRSGAKFSKNFTFGGYFGYGFYDKKYKYGGELQWRFGRNKSHMISAFYDHKTFHYGHEDIFLFNENKIEDRDHLINSLYRLAFEPNRTPYIGLRSQLSLRYKYEKQGLRAWTEVFANRTMSNEYMPFIHKGTLIDEYQQIALKVGLRSSGKSRSVDYFFSRFYLGSSKPVFNALFESGFVKLGEYSNPYAKLTLGVRQQIPFVLGSFRYDIEAAGLLGKVPYPSLIIARGGRSSYYSKHEFILMNEFEFLNDVFVGARLQYQTPGFIFGYIPQVKKLGIRENLIFNVAYGAMLQNHSELLALPAQSSQFGNMPYMECGVGFSNIIRLFTVESIWRLTYRNAPNATNWAIRFRIDLDF